MKEQSSISKRLREARLEKGHTMKEVASFLNVPTSTYRDWEYGSPIKGEPYIKICQLFNLSLSYLLLGEAPSHEREEIINHIKSINSEVKLLEEKINLAFLN